jgi:hypothetical protein
LPAFADGGPGISDIVFHVSTWGCPFSKFVEWLCKVTRRVAHTPVLGSLTQRLLVVRPITQRRGIKVSAVGPNPRAHLKIDADSVEQHHISERRILFTGQDRLEVDGLSRSVLEVDPQSAGRHNLEINYAMDGMAHTIILAAQSDAGFFLVVASPNRPAIRSDVIRPRLQPSVAAAAVFKVYQSRPFRGVANDDA